MLSGESERGEGRFMDRIRKISRGWILGLVTLMACTPSAAPAGPSPTPAPTKLTVAQTGDIDSLDLQLMRRNEAFNVMYQVSQGFTQRDPQTMQPTASLATSWT